MRVLDLFSGLGGWSAAFRDAGHEVVTVDLDPDFKPTIAANVLALTPGDLPGPWDLILSSPPCNCFSVASIGSSWADGMVPKKPETFEAIALVAHTLSLIHALKPTYWVMENPRAMMRNLPFMGVFQRQTVTYCQYGHRAQKPTDLWGRFPPKLRLKKPCSPGDSCHEAAPRGTKTGGVQGMSGSAARAEVPRGLSAAFLEAMP